MCSRPSGARVVVDAAGGVVGEGAAAAGGCFGGGVVAVAGGGGPGGVSAGGAAGGEVGCHPVQEAGQCVPVPDLQRVRGQGLAGCGAGAGQDGEFTGQVWVGRPAGGDGPIGLPGVIVVDPAGDVVEPVPQVPPQGGCAGGRVPGPGEVVGVAELRFVL